MKPLILALVAVLCLLRAHAANLKLDGELTWEITEPRCTFTLAGAIQNPNPAGSTSGTLKLVLWVTSSPFPARGYIVGEHVLGELDGGYQFTDFSVRTRSEIPEISGGFHFTIAILEFTGAGWRTVLAVPTGQQTLLKGDFLHQAKWSIPATKVRTPAATLATGDVLTLRTAATGEFNLLPAPSRISTTVQIRKNGRARVIDPDGKRPATFTYARGKGPLAGKRVRNARLALTLPATRSRAAAKAKVILYFHSPTSGIHQTTVIDAAGKDVTWGTFTLQ